MTAVALGTMTLSGGYGAVDYEAAVDVLTYAVEAGVTLLDTADAYLDGQERIAAALARTPGHQVQVVTKAGLSGPPGQRTVRGHRSHLLAACTDSLRRLRVEALDALLIHRVDPHVPVEESIDALADLVASGHVRTIGICSADPEIVRRAHAVHPLDFVQTELSLCERGPLQLMVPLLKDLDITLLAQSPLSRGILASAVRRIFPPDDARSHLPGHREERERELVIAFHRLAADLRVSPVLLALRWLKEKAPEALPIPGVRTVGQVDISLAAHDRQLSATESFFLGELVAAECQPV